MGPSATLPETLAAWRLDRSSAALANRVDDAGARVPMPPLPPKLQRWWMDRARVYDPVTATALLATLQIQARGGGRRGEWANLLDRIDALLVWPDDPRVALALAGCIRVEPFYVRYRMHGGPDRGLRPTADTIVRRILAIGDLRAISRISPLGRGFGEDIRAELVQAISRLPSPRTTDDSVADAWRAVIDDPFDLQTRLVLADAYLERGDPRGELIALQCAPYLAIEAAAAAGRPIDRHGAFGVGAERIAALLEQNWYRWFGEVGLIASRRSMRAGLISRIWVGAPTPPVWATSFVARHRELCALEEIAPHGEREPYVEFLRALPRQPRWVHLDDRSLAMLQGAALPFIGVRYAVGARDPLEVVNALVAIAPKLERLQLNYPRAQHMDALHEVMATFPAIKIEMKTDGW